MGCGVIDSSGAVGGFVAGNRRSFVASAPYRRMQIDMEFEIHNLEQLAYAAVLRAFKAQSDALTWEKEGLITELRKELRVSDNEHRELLTDVNADDLIRRIREWRESGGNRNTAPNVMQHVNNQLPSPTISASRKRQKTSISGNPFGSPQALQLQSVGGTIPPLSSVVKWGSTSGTGGRRANVGQPAFIPAKPMQYQFTDHVSSGAPMDDLSETLCDLFIGRRVMIRWPADNNFYEAVITEYNPVNGRHSLVYDSNTPNATLEWVNIKEVPPEDIRWVGGDPAISHLGDVSAPNPRGPRASSVNQFANEIQPPQNGVTLEDSEEIEILHTDTLIKKVEKILDASRPDMLEIDKAKKLLKEHEQTLIQVIEKLADACDINDEHPLGHGHSTARQHNVDHHWSSHELEIAGRASSHELGRV